MQMPIPPVSQCRKRHATSPCQENHEGLSASSAPACRLRIQITGAHAIWFFAAGLVVVVVVILKPWCQRVAVLILANLGEIVAQVVPNAIPAPESSGNAYLSRTAHEAPQALLSGSTGQHTVP